MLRNYSSGSEGIARAGADLGGGGFRGLQLPPPNGQSHGIKCSTTNVLGYGTSIDLHSKELGGSSGQF